ncbi:PQQ-binding-like beta-propeller repeat protein, partial [Candidatus Sumerlaeota bacterium]|nr:PQQ-binding-like beta-propeller repeat protein [Candidatus Sumerlaeota bacterium]
EQWKGKRLPYVSNLVNLLVAEDLAGVPMDEVMRVLCPKGVACIKHGQDWVKTVKPRPDNIDEWTHWRYDSKGGSVSHDLAVGPPRHMQWVGSPLWSRNHDHTASLNGLVAAGGRIFYVIDEGSRASIQLPAKWALIARDAFNGTVLWKRPIETWWNHLYPLKSGPAQVPRRLVAEGEAVYVTLGINAPVSALDAATGKALWTNEQTRTAEEIILSNGLLFLVANANSKPIDYQEEDPNCWTEQRRASVRWGWDEEPRLLMAVAADTGKRVWEQQCKVVPMTLAADGKRLVFHDGEALVCLEQAGGKQMWRSEPIARNKVIPTGWSPSLMIYDDVILFSGEQRALAAVSLKDGKLLWTCKLHPSGHFCPEDVLVVNGLVWSGDIANAISRSSGAFTGRDPRTGEIKSEFQPDIDPFAIMHQRCYPSKATDRYIIPSWIGTEFIDPTTKHWEIHHWVRGGCVYGVMPANGMIYAPPHACACYYQSKLNGFCALAPESNVERQATSDKKTPPRLERGPAYSRIQNPKSKIQNPEDWPTYRHDAARSGFTATALPADLKAEWSSEIGGKLSSVTIADGRLYVASIDDHTLHALDAVSGKRLWQYIAGGRIDSPPTIHGNAVLFGSADGWVYCLRASDGQLAWRFRAAPDDRRHVAYEQVESVWPVHGSVLVLNNVLYCVAGRSMFLDGGLRLVRLDPSSGKLLSETVLDDKDPDTGKNLQSLIEHKKMPVALPDVLCSDGKHVYMRSQEFDLDGRRTQIAPGKIEDQEGSLHLFSPTGLLDDTWWHRSYWIYGKNAGEGWSEWYIAARQAPSGQILVFDENRVYGYARDPEYLCNSSVLEYRLFASGKQVVPERVAKLKTVKDDTVNWRTRVEQLTPEQQTAVDYKWLVSHPPLLARAMVLAGTTLFAAGPPDIEDEKAAWGRSLDPAVQASHARQAEALEGKMGGLLWALTAADGKKLADRKIESVPVFDGMAAARGRLYMATTDGRVICMGGK